LQAQVAVVLSSDLGGLGELGARIFCQIKVNWAALGLAQTMPGQAA
jgi:hypothetical protein